MSADQVFSLTNFFALPGWGILAWAIYRRDAWLRDRIAGLAWPLALSALYSVLILFFFFQAEGGYDSLANVQRLFTFDWVAVAGWAHYLAFDLFIAAFAARRFAEAGVKRRWMIPVLPTVFIFGPMGFLLAEAILFLATPETETIA